MNNHDGDMQRSDVSELHPGLDETGNAVPNTRQNITLPEATSEALRQHTLQVPSPLTVSALRRFSRQPNLRSAFAELRRKSIISWREATIPVDDPLLIWDGPAHYLDSISILGLEVGFGPIVLPPGARPAQLTCKLRMASRPLRDKYLPIGWNYDGRSYFIGFLESKPVWLLFYPDDPNNMDDHEPSSATSAMSQIRQRRFSLFWANILQYLPGTNVVVREVYADCTSDEAYAAASNLT